MFDRQVRTLAAALIAACVVVPMSHAADRSTQGAESFIPEAMPAGYQVIRNELDGPVFADEKGRTLYTWSVVSLRSGNAGEERGKPTCDDKVYTETTGFMSPYPPGLILPDLESRMSCTAMWPPALAPDGAKAVGRWTVLKGPSGRSQWAYNGQPLYTSAFDKKPGDVLGGSKTRRGGDGEGALRVPIGPQPDVPPQFSIFQDTTGRALALKNGLSVYASDRDGRNLSRCTDECLVKWEPVTAPLTAKPSNEWSIFERAPGIRQWAYRGQPLYSFKLDARARSTAGSDEKGWSNVYTQKLPVPSALRTQDARTGQVLADKYGRTIYTYNCNDDAFDQQPCDHPSTTQAYRLAMCGKGDARKCIANFPYVVAEKADRIESQVWSIMTIDPSTGRQAPDGKEGALRVWAFRERPLYLCWRDKKPGDLECDNFGEFSGDRNGYKAFWLRRVTGP